MLETPVVIILFNRPELTARVFARIAAAKPRQLFLIADGPRIPAEAQACARARAVVEKVNWECEVFRKFSEINLGVIKGPRSGLDWVFSQVEEAIILEDDCLPEPSFFQFSSELLERYRHDDRVMGVSGENYWPESASWGYSYYFSNYAICWGLATWKRAWNLLDWELKSWPEARSRNVCYDFFNSGFEQEYWLDVFEGIYTGAYPGSYDYKWLYTCLMQNGLTIHPVVNLISNIGYGQEATHTRFRGPLAERATGLLCIERHPPFVFPLRQANQAIFDWRFPGLDMKKSRTLSFRVTQPARKLKHWLTMKGVFGKSKSG